MDQHATVHGQEGKEEVAHIIAWLRQHTDAGADLVLDSRAVMPGDVFVACQGTQTDGVAYIQDAIKQGAVAIIFDASLNIDDATQAYASQQHVPMRGVSALATRLGRLADQWYDKPSKDVYVIAITGTNGKTSCASWVAQALNLNGVPCATIGTLGVVLPDGTNLGGHLTTPDVLSMHRTMAYLRDHEIYNVAIEASSIGLVQGRMDGLRIRIAGFTNLSQDHLDYHQDMAAYEAAKRILFQWPKLRLAVLNGDDPAGLRLAQQATAKEVLTYSLDTSSAADLRAMHYVFDDYGLSFKLHAEKGDIQVISRLVGEHNISNLLLTAGILRGLGWKLSKVARTLAQLTAVPGRLETVTPIGSTQNKPLVVVDYAHTPDALARVLEALRANAQARDGRLIVVFGCGGDRDRTKRPLMGQVAEQYADSVYITSDNPRTEEPQAILNEIMAGLNSPHSDAIVLNDTDRAYAILSAVLRADANDVVLLAGKGHEDYQEIQGQRYYFDDKEWARLALLMRDEVAISTDSRQVGEGQLFVALVGERFDGHDFLPEVAQAKPVAAVVSQRQSELSQLPQIQVSDTQKALSVMARAWRERFDLPLVAITGSNGKTTTKEMMASIMVAHAGQEQVLATQGNLNNHLGVPLTLLRLRSHHIMAVIELGMNHPGEIAELAALALPTVALLTNAQREHQEFMHSVDAVAQENGQSIAQLPASGVAIYPVHPPYTAVWDELSVHCRALRFAVIDEGDVVDAGSDLTTLMAQADVTAQQLQSTAQGMRFEVMLAPTAVALSETAATATNTTASEVTKSGATKSEGTTRFTVSLPILGVHNVHNAVAATAAAVALGIEPAAIQQGLAQLAPVQGRLQAYTQAGGHVLIDDSYNANPDSVRAAIDVLSTLSGPTCLVLGDMGEVGEQGPAVHAEVGAYAKAQGVTYMLTYGEATKATAQAFGEGAQHHDTIEALLDAVDALESCHLLVKGSRSMRMERVVAHQRAKKPSKPDECDTLKPKI